MSHNEKNEVDVLLRALARKAPDRMSSAGADKPEAHLDPDELSSFAENVLPAATRARYTSHLADCDECRTIVTQLTQARGVPAMSAPDQAVSSFWTNVRAFFTPQVLQYAMPALLILVMMGVGLIVYKQQQRPGDIAQTTNTTTPTSAPTAEQGKPAQPSAVASQPSTADADAAKPTTVAKNSSNDKPQASSESSAEDASKKRGAGAAVAQPSYAPEPTTGPPAEAPPPPKAAVTTSTEVVQQRDKQAERDQEAQRADSKVAKDTSEGRTAARGMSNLPMVGGLARPQKNEALAKEKGASSSTQTRSVAGRQFRREDDSWIDTAYEAGSATVVVRRGSDQYRALIADEPQLKTVAESLSGTVIVVWKGRAYRFR